MVISAISNMADDVTTKGPLKSRANKSASYFVSLFKFTLRLTSHETCAALFFESKIY